MKKIFIVKATWFEKTLNRDVTLIRYFSSLKKALKLIDTYLKSAFKVEYEYREEWLE